MVTIKDYHFPKPSYSASRCLLREVRQITTKW